MGPSPGGAWGRRRTRRIRDGAVSLTSARVLTITDRCWCCRSKVRGVVGVLVEMSAGRRFVAFTDIAETLAELG